MRLRKRKESVLQQPAENINAEADEFGAMHYRHDDELDSSLQLMSETSQNRAIDQEMFSVSFGMGQQNMVNKNRIIGQQRKKKQDSGEKKRS